MIPCTAETLIIKNLPALEKLLIPVQNDPSIFFPGSREANQSHDIHTNTTQLSQTLAKRGGWTEIGYTGLVPLSDLGME